MTETPLTLIVLLAIGSCYVVILRSGALASLVNWACDDVAPSTWGWVIFAIFFFGWLMPW